ncbi:hypothetical protein IF1G_02879 [Cordyceps javanica]|uniref:Uncharacterized protein n=1 Tax=Cordyceps javanica TaxID=43265 RepID=A0A545VB09_9HYPO|nr:hypothetical protein IF1G_02879 [Cordyceps javanica]
MDGLSSACDVPAFVYFKSIISRGWSASRGLPFRPPPSHSMGGQTHVTCPSCYLLLYIRIGQPGSPQRGVDGYLFSFLMTDHMPRATMRSAGSAASWRPQSCLMHPGCVLFSLPIYETMFFPGLESSDEAIDEGV